MLQLAVTAHVEVANEVVFADGILLHGLITLVRFPRLRGQDCEYTDFEAVSQRDPAAAQPRSAVVIRVDLAARRPPTADMWTSWRSSTRSRCH